MADNQTPKTPQTFEEWFTASKVNVLDNPRLRSQEQALCKAAWDARQPEIATLTADLSAARASAIDSHMKWVKAEAELRVAIDEVVSANMQRARLMAHLTAVVATIRHATGDCYCGGYIAGPKSQEPFIDDVHEADCALILAEAALTPSESVTHLCPIGDAALTPCCQKSPFALPLTDRLTADPSAVTCSESVTQEGK